MIKSDLIGIVSDALKACAIEPHLAVLKHVPGEEQTDAQGRKYRPAVRGDVTRAEFIADLLIDGGIIKVSADSAKGKGGS